MLLDILAIPLEFIKENLTGWTILILVIIIIYFVCLRNYYLQKERFYYQSIAEKNIENIEDIQDVEKDILEEQNNKTNNKISNTKTSNTKTSNIKTSNIKTSNTKTSNTKNNKIKGKSNLDKKTDTKIDEKTDEKTDTKKQKNENTIEAFDNNITNQYSPSMSMSVTKIKTSQQTSQQDTITSYISTTMFDNLNLNPAQIQSCKLKYNDIIAQYIIDLGKLSQLQKNNRYLNTQKQFDLIIAKGIDNIINYLNNTIKSYNVLTRTSIKSEVINTLTSVIELLIDKTNNDLANQMNTLAALNSTTIDYATQLTEINDLRGQLEEYIDVDTLLSEYSNKANNKNKEVNSILDKSFILPIYERNFDKIKQLVNSDFNNNENNLADKYSKAYMDFIEEKKKEDLGVNPLRLASQIESGLVSLLTGYSSKSTKSKQPINANSLNNDNTNSLIEQYGFTESNISNLKNNPIPNQEEKLLSNTQMNDSNIIRDPGNRGSYLINNKTQRDILEGFEEKTNPNGNPNLLKAINNNSNDNSNDNSNGKKKKNDNNDIISNLLSTNFLQYIMDFISDKLNVYMQYYNYKMGNGTTNKGNNNGDGGDNSGNGNNFKLEDNMIPAGFLLFILSMLIYFIDTTS
jgi:hypothetical protein